MKRIITKINEYFSESEFNKRLDLVFDRIKELREEHSIDVEVSDVNIGAYKQFLKDNLHKINDFINEINKKGRIYHCDFPTMWISSMDDLESGPEIDELEIEEIPIHIEYSYPHVYLQWEKLRRDGKSYEIDDRYKVDYQRTTDEWTTDDLMTLVEEGAFHSEMGIIGVTPEAVKNCIENI